MKSNKWNLMKNTHLGYLTTDPKNLGTNLTQTEPNLNIEYIYSIQKILC